MIAADSLPEIRLGPSFMDVLLGSDLSLGKDGLLSLPDDFGSSLSKANTTDPPQDAPCFGSDPASAVQLELVTPYTGPDRLTALPDELLLILATHLSPAAHACLQVSCGRFYDLLPQLSVPDMVAAEKEYFGARKYFACSLCHRFRQKLAFTGNQLYGDSTGQPRPHKRFCIECAVSRGMWARGTRALRAGGTWIILCRNCEKINEMDSHHRCTECGDAGARWWQQYHDAKDKAVADARAKEEARGPAVREMRRQQRALHT